MQSFSSRIWTRVAVSISYDDNHYTTGTSNSRWIQFADSIDDVVMDNSVARSRFLTTLYDLKSGPWLNILRSETRPHCQVKQFKSSLLPRCPPYFASSFQFIPAQTDTCHFNSSLQPRFLFYFFENNSGRENSRTEVRTMPIIGKSVTLGLQTLFF